MDDRSFDRLAKLLGEATDRRAGLKAALAAVLGGGAAAAALDMDAEAKRKGKDKDRRRDEGRNGAGPDADRRRKKRKKKCNPACEGGYVCQKGACVCPSGVVCGGACCASGKACVEGACADRPDPVACIAAGEPCKNVGRQCCDGRVCASGQGGDQDIACYAPKTGACSATSDCVYGMKCQQGRCAPPPPAGLASPCDAAAQQLCTTPGAVCTAYTGAGAPNGAHCTLPVGMVCTGDPQCTCYKCFYPNGGASGGSRSGRASANTKACCLPQGQQCQNENQCCVGLSCVGGICGGTICAPEGGDCSEVRCCGTLNCNASKVCSSAPTCVAAGGSCASASCCEDHECVGDVCVALPECTATVSTFAGFKEALATASTNSDSAPQVICVQANADPYVFGETLFGTSNGTGSNTITIRNKGTGKVTFSGGSNWDGQSAPNLAGDGVQILSLTSGACGANCAGFVITGIDFEQGLMKNGIPDREASGGCIFAKGALTIRNAAFSRCAAFLDGGAVWHDTITDVGDSTLVIQRSTFQDCFSRLGGAVVAKNSNLSMTDVSITSCQAVRGGGGVWARGGANGATPPVPATVSLNRVTMTDNEVTEAGYQGGSGLLVTEPATEMICANQSSGPTTWSIDNDQAGQKDCVVVTASSGFFQDCGCKTTQNA